MSKRQANYTTQTPQEHARRKLTDHQKWLVREAHRHITDARAQLRARQHTDYVLRHLRLAAEQIEQVLQGME